MVDMTTVMHEDSDEKNRRVLSIDGHTVAAPKLFIQKKKEAATGTSVAESSVQTVYGAFDAAGVPLDSKVVIETKIRYPANARATEKDACLAVHREMVASDNFTRVFNSQRYLNEA